jgi:hypothetical protein
MVTASLNHKGCLDVDTVKGCTYGMRDPSGRGCYGECYARTIAVRYGIAFDRAVSRGFADIIRHRDTIIHQVMTHPASWYRIGVMGDPSHDWDHTIRMIRAIRPARKTAVIVTKHWVPLSDDQISKLLESDVIFNTSTSGLDTDAQMRYRVGQIQRLREYGIPSVNRVVTCDFGESDWARECSEAQEYLLSLTPVIDNPLRVSPGNPRVLSGEIRTERRHESVGGGTLVSLHDQSVYLGDCPGCPDQCGVSEDESTRMGGEWMTTQAALFEADEAANMPLDQHGTIEFRHVESVVGSGFEEAVAELALADGIAHRAARKNMQIHSAIILLMGGEFAGFFTFQVNTEVGEFCLLQSVIRPDVYSPELYLAMTQEVIECNTDNLPMLMTTNPKSKFETPEMFENLGFDTYLKMSGFHYMLNGDAAYHRLKLMCHITMTNVWNSTKGDWIRLKKEWNERIAEAGEAAEIPNPTFATREGCWQGEAGFANVVTGRSHNGNASVLDPVACEVIVRMFSPREGRRIYNPFGGGVQFGFVAGASGYEYVASEIRKNQCDANNALCREFPGVEWVQSDSSTYEPEGDFDLVFSCPPYYRVERYFDYDDVVPEGEINSLKTYDMFRDTLFAGYEKALEHLKDDRFFVVMTGDSRGPSGSYFCHEAETELFFKERGLSVYNKIVYLEAEFTRLAQAKRTLNFRKFPKREQKIIVAYKGDPKAIRDEFQSVGRL